MVVFPVIIFLFSIDIPNVNLCQKDCSFPSLSFVLLFLYHPSIVPYLFSFLLIHPSYPFLHDILLLLTNRLQSLSHSFFFFIIIFSLDPSFLPSSLHFLSPIPPSSLLRTPSLLTSPRRSHPSPPTRFLSRTFIIIKSLRSSRSLVGGWGGGGYTHRSR